MDKTIPKLIQEILQAAGWSQEELARQLDLPFKTVNSWLNGHNEPRQKNLLALQQLHLDIVGREHVSVEYLQAFESRACNVHFELPMLLENQEMLDQATLYLTYHTNTIEGSTMTLEDVRTVLESADTIVPDKSYREQAEARNHRAAFLYLLSELKTQGESFQWTSELIRELHQRLMNGILESAGTYRTYPVRVTGSRTPRANHLSVPDKIEDLVEYMNSPVKNPIARLAKTHAMFEKIHPFGDGNGRTGRLIMFAQAIQFQVAPPLVLKERKRAYYKYLEHAYITDDYLPLRLFIAESILATDKLL